MLLQKVGEIDLSMALIYCQQACFRQIPETQTQVCGQESWPLEVLKLSSVAQTNRLRYKRQLDGTSLQTLSWFV